MTVLSRMVTQKKLQYRKYEPVADDSISPNVKMSMEVPCLWTMIKAGPGMFFRRRSWKKSSGLSG